MVSGADLVVETCNNILNEQHDAVKQSELLSDYNDLKSAPKIFKTDCKINWMQSTKNTNNFIRGLNPYPGAYCTITLADGSEKSLKIFEAKQVNYNGKAGDIIVSDNKLIAFTSDGALELIDVQMEGKKRMLACDFLRGVKLN